MRPFLRPALALAVLVQSLTLFAMADPGQRPSGIYFGTLLSSSGPVAGAVLQDLTSGATAVTNSAGRFHLTGVAAEGTTVLISIGQSLHQANLQPLSQGRGSGVIAIVSGHLATIPVDARTNPSAQIEGLVQTVDSGAGTLTVADQRLGTVNVTTTSSTVIRHGGTAMTLDQVQAG